ncbi:hypothetical protein IEQ34_003432 [Dendrobium chrysotoxum]|uniref:Uncharacterized protein n=1 Tax=Dendrobium chrysotoxum TaxID=161865 RepID=A0AAV7HJL6_DENCH|nr:hypothetical protein IEQ34_003432 [Dendrobium chrysotoxum]
MVVLCLATMAMQVIHHVSSRTPLFVMASWNSPFVHLSPSPQPAAATMNFNNFNTAMSSFRSNGKGVDEDDGDEMRKVPTGANPLHNR